MVFKIYKNNLTPDAIDFILLIKKECKQLSNSEFKLDIEKGDFEAITQRAMKLTSQL
jgi:hypothetical protein